MYGIIEGSGGRSGSEECTVTRNLVMNGYTAITKESDDEPIAGTLNVQSISNFNVYGYGVRRILLNWKNPSKGAFSGVIIVYRTDRYPNSITDGTRIYKGYGSSNGANAVSSVTLTMPAENTSYYFAAIGYAVKNGAEWLSSSLLKGSAKTSQSRYAFSSSTTFTVPDGVTRLTAFCLAGGGGGGGAWSGPYDWYSNGHTTVYTGFGEGGGGAGGRVNTVECAVTPGSRIAITVGAGGAAGVNRSGSGNNAGAGGTGGDSSFGSMCIARGAGGGGAGVTSNFWGGTGGSGGSGGGGGAGCSAGMVSQSHSGGTGGSNGSNGTTGYRGHTYASSEALNNGGAGAGYTTGEFGNANNTRYAGGGGGGQYDKWGSNSGANGGGEGAVGCGYASLRNAGAGSDGYGGGGGGGVISAWHNLAPARGGSGLVVLLLQ